MDCRFGDAGFPQIHPSAAKTEWNEGAPCANAAYRIQVVGAAIEIAILKHAVRGHRTCVGTLDAATLRREVVLIGPAKIQS